MKYLLDTNIYLGAFRSEERKERFRSAFFPLIPQTFLSSVVAFELSVNSKDRKTRELVGNLTDPMLRTGRVVSPRFEDWLQASEILTDIEAHEKRWKSKLPALLNDVLIALCARQIGATLITCNRDDFLLIHRHTDFHLRVLMD